MSAVAAANGASSFFNSVLNSPTAVGPVDPITMAAIGVASPSLAGRVPGAVVNEMDPAVWYDGSHDPPLMSTFYQEDDENFFTAPL